MFKLMIAITPMESLSAFRFKPYATVVYDLPTHHERLVCVLQDIFSLNHRQAIPSWLLDRALPILHDDAHLCLACLPTCNLLSFPRIPSSSPKYWDTFTNSSGIELALRCASSLWCQTLSTQSYSMFGCKVSHPIRFNGVPKIIVISIGHHHRRFIVNCPVERCSSSEW